MTNLQIELEEVVLRENGGQCQKHNSLLYALVCLGAAEE